MMSSARCAVCLHPIVTGDRFGLVREFVVHRGCQGGRIKIQSDLIDTEREKLSLVAKLERVAQRGDENDSLRRQLNRTHDDYMDALTTISGLNAQLQQKEQALTSERNLRALVELRERTTRPPAASTSPEHAPAAEEISSEPVDLTAARFSLLELD